MDPALLAFIGLAALLTITPGADMALVTQTVVARGVAPAVATILGILTGCLVHGVASALGLSVILAHSATAFAALKLVGAAYLLYLGVQGLRRLGRAAGHWEAEAVSLVPPSAAVRRAWVESFGHGLLTNLLNPKVALFYLMVLPQFVPPGHPVLARSLLLAGIHNLMGLLWLASYAFLLGRVGRVARPWLWRRLEGFTSVVLIVLGIRLAFERR